ncbi:MAG: KaiC domain-containing protein [Candidatus Nanohaloarchaeota archaeon QJJ-7]|nr:KaiC domain-containing protein [Candidatus Nanohaloarchaeota archaeon QJJ-7]
MADDLENLGYRELQEKAKEAGIKANQSSEELRKALREKTAGDGEEPGKRGMDFRSMKKDIQDKLGSGDDNGGPSDPEVLEEVERISTGVPGMDELLEGGIPRNNLVLVPGGAGTGKSTFGLQFLVEGMKNGEKGVFVSLDERLEKVRRNARLLGWDLEGYEEEGLLNMMRPEMYNFDDLITKIDTTVKNMEAERVVLDSLTILGSYYENSFDLRRKIMELNRKFSKLDSTVLAISEIAEAEDGISRFGVEEFAMDGIITLYYIKERNVFQRGITVRKMRGSDHSTEIHPLEIGRGGITVYPEEKVFSEF